MTRILCITATYPPHHTGGYEVSCRDVMVRLADRGHDVTVLTSEERRPGVPTPIRERQSSPAVRREIRRYFRDDQLWAPSPRQRWKVERDNQRAIAAALQAARPDVVAIWHVGAFSLGIVTAVLEAEVPVVYAVCDDWLTYCTSLDQWSALLSRLGPRARWLRSVLRVPTVPPDVGTSGPVCFISETTRQRAMRFGPWEVPDSTVVYSGIDRMLFTPRTSTPPWRWRVLYVGRFDPRKGVETLIRSLPMLPGGTVIELDGLGDEAEQARLRSLAEGLGVGSAVRLHRSSRSALPARYRDADVFVFPSEWEEPFGLTPLEAMACGVPVVGTGVGGSGDFLIDEVNCLRFSPGDAAGLAGAIHRLAQDDSLRRRLIREGEITATFFDVDQLADTFESWYVAAADGFRRGRPADRHFTTSEMSADG